MNRDARSYYEQTSLWDHVDSGDEERIRKMAEMVPGDVDTVLDVGCGSGLLVRKLSKQGRRAIGLDWSLTALKRLGGNAVAGDIRKTPFRDESFDMVVCSEVLEHLPVRDFEQILQELDRLTRKWLFITVPYEEILEAYFSKCADCGCVYHLHHHVRSFDIEKLSAFFPDYVMEALETFGRIEWIGSLEARIWHGIGGHWVASKTGVCPQCGSKNQVIPDRGLRDVLGLALARGVRLFHAPTKPRWLLALMQRKPRVS